MAEVPSSRSGEHGQRWAYCEGRNTRYIVTLAAEDLPRNADIGHANSLALAVFIISPTV
jgi:hypothetical protein